MNQESISQLLSKAGSAHQNYEQTVLNGVYDQEWPVWYADYVMERGLNELLPRPVSVDLLSQFLTESNQRYEQTDKRQTWADFTAVDLLNNLDRRA